MFFLIKSIRSISLRNAINPRIHHNLREITKRLAIFVVLLIITFVSHKIFSLINEEIIYCILHITYKFHSCYATNFFTILKNDKIRDSHNLIFFGNILIILNV